jgi:peptidoglycan lytic transglycosylase B
MIQRAGSWRGIVVTILLLAGAAPAAASTDFASWLDGVRTEARERGLKPATIAALDAVTPIPRVVELDRKQPEFTLTFAEYLKRVVPRRRIDKGRALLARHRALLTRIAAKYRVQPRFIVALWGIETDFGRLTGGFSVIQALATLAYDGRRSAYFRKELFNALTIVDQGHIAARQMTGSWAGAMGQNQFMPSSFLRYAVDDDGDGRRNIWTSQADVFASTANYLKRVGWRDDQTWGRPVRLPPGFDAGLIGLKTTKRLSQWQALGVRRADGRDLPRRDLSASVMVPGAKRAGFSPSLPAFVVYGNYRAILKWNRSHFFAVAVGRLADGIGGR